LCWPDLDGALEVEGVVAETGPWVVFGFEDHAAGDWVSVQVAELLDALFFGEDVEVVVAGQPEGFFGELFGDGAFQGANDRRKRVGSRFGEEEVDVFGHHYVAEEFEFVFATDGFE
jgi:hypothetical protein